MLKPLLRFLKTNSITKKTIMPIGYGVQRKLQLAKVQKAIKEDRILDLVPFQERAGWEQRIKEVLSSSDNQYIPRHKDAGKLINGNLVMHNGLIIDPVSYYGYSVLEMLLQNKGVHEPQEERIFAEVLKQMPAGATMLELGAYWGFYSLWFQKEVKSAKNYMVEPILQNMYCGVRNFKLNNYTGNFTNAFIGEQPGMSDRGVRIISVDSYMKDKGLSKLEILHADIQGFELEMLKGAKENLSKGSIAYIFISTHSNDLHYDCRNLLKEHGYQIDASIDLDDTFSYDGLIVAHHPNYVSLDHIKLSKKTLEPVK